MLPGCCLYPACVCLNWLYTTSSWPCASLSSPTCRAMLSGPRGSHGCRNLAAEEWPSLNHCQISGAAYPCRPDDNSMGKIWPTDWDLRTPALGERTNIHWEQFQKWVYVEGEGKGWANCCSGAQACRKPIPTLTLLHPRLELKQYSSGSTESHFNCFLKSEFSNRNSIF